MAKRQNNQLELAFGSGVTGEARSPLAEGTEADTASSRPQSPAASEPCMATIVERDNLRKALAQVRRNKGAPGVDGMTVDDLPLYLKEHWPSIRNQLLDGTYRPQPVRRVEIPKAGGGTRALGIPTVLDRFIQQAVLQVLQAHWDPTFAAASYGFRPGRSAHRAVARAQAHIADGYGWVVDLDLEKFFDRVNHDILMGLVAERVADRGIRRLVRGFLSAGVLVDGLVGPTDEGTPQGGPLSPLLSNLMLDVLDRELIGRGHRFVRYADDCNIYVRSRRAGERVLTSVTGFVARRLRLRVNAAKSAVDRPWDCQAERYAREGVDLSLSTLADQVGACAVTLAPLHALIEAHVLAADRLHGDDTPVPVLAKTKTATGRLWTYVRDDRPFGGGPPAALFKYSRDRRGEHPQRHLADWSGILQADAYGGFGPLYEAERQPGPVIEAPCWAHARRRFFELADVAKNRRKKKPPSISPIALEAAQRIDAIFAIERGINGADPATRLAVRRAETAPLVENLETWLRAERDKLSRQAPVAKAIDYMLKRWDRFTRFLGDGRDLPLSNNAAERALRGIALGRKSWLFAGSDRGGASAPPSCTRSSRRRS